MAPSTILPPGRAARSTPVEVQDSPTPPRSAFEAPGSPGSPGSRIRAPLSIPSGRSTDPGDVFVGLAISVTLHVLVLVVASMWFRLPDVRTLLAVREQAATSGVPVLLIDVSEWPDATGEALASATPAPATGAGSGAAPSSTEGALRAPRPQVSGAVPFAGDPAVVAPGAGVPGAAAAPGGTPARDRFQRTLDALRPRLLDPRLRPGNADALRTDEERAAERVYARINALNDSILAEMERERRATDWTFTDSEGRRWGVSPGKLHLGGIELPLPLDFTTPEQRERIREWEEIQAQAVQGEVDETFDDRVEAIRERREAERAE